MVERSQQIELHGLHGSATPAEAAAVVAALERFMRETAPVAPRAPEGLDPWLKAALLEGVSREIDLDVPDSWING